MREMIRTVGECWKNVRYIIGIGEVPVHGEPVDRATVLTAKQRKDGEWWYTKKMRCPVWTRHTYRYTDAAGIVTSLEEQVQRPPFRKNEREECELLIKAALELCMCSGTNVYHKSVLYWPEREISREVQLMGWSMFAEFEERQNALITKARAEGRISTSMEHIELHCFIQQNMSVLADAFEDEGCRDNDLLRWMRELTHIHVNFSEHWERAERTMYFEDVEYLLMPYLWAASPLNPKAVLTIGK